MCYFYKLKCGGALNGTSLAANLTPVKDVKYFHVATYVC